MNKLMMCVCFAAVAGGAWAGSWVSGPDLATITATDDLYLGGEGPFSLSADKSLYSIQLNTAQGAERTFDFTEGNHTLTLTRNDAKVFAFFASGVHVFFKGGKWTTEQSGSNFKVCETTFYNGISAVSSNTLTLANSCVLDWSKGAGLTVSSSGSGSTLEVTDGSKVLAGSDVRLSAWGTVNAMKVLSGGEASFGSLYYDRNPGDTNNGRMYPNLVEVAGEGSQLETSGNFEMGKRMGGRLYVHDGGKLSVGWDLSLSEWGTANLVARDGATVSVKDAVLLYGNSTVLISNSTFSVGSAGICAQGSGNVVELLDPVEPTSPSVTFCLDGVVPANCRFTASGANAQPNISACPFGGGATNCVYELKDGAVARSTCANWLQLMVNATNNVFRLTGGAKFENVTAGNKFTLIGSNWGCSCTGNAIEILDGAEFRTESLRVAGVRNRVVVSNATLNVTGTEAFIVGHSTGNDSDALVVCGETPKVTMPGLNLGVSSKLRFEVGEKGYPFGHAAVELVNGGLSMNLSDKIEVDCANWKDGEFEIVLLRQKSEPNANFISRVDEVRRSLPKGYRIKFVGNDLVLTRPGRGAAIIVR